MTQIVIMISFETHAHAGFLIINVNINNWIKMGGGQAEFPIVGGLR